jgi:hypothetical protein
MPLVPFSSNGLKFNKIGAYQFYSFLRTFKKILVITNLPKIPCSQPEQHTHFDIPFYSWLNHSRFSIQFFLSAQPSDSTRSLEEPIVVEAHSFARIHSLSNTALRMFTY